MPVQGLWSPFGINLPDFGLTEKLGSVMHPGSYGSQWLQNQNNVAVYRKPNTAEITNQYITSSADAGTVGSTRRAPDRSQLFSQQLPRTGLDNNAPRPQNTGGGQNPPFNPPSAPPPAGDQPYFDPNEQIRNEINSAWDNYIGSLGGLNTGLTEQRTAQENIAQSQLDTGTSALNAQKSASLKDIGSNIRNAFQAGNIYLGARGAGDSSASNMYSFALNKEAAKQTGELNNFMTQQMTSLKSTYDQQMNSIANWFAEQQNAVRQMIAQGQLNKQQDIQQLSYRILDEASKASEQIKTAALNKKAALEQWAMNNSTNIGQLTSNMAQIPQAFGMPTVGSDGSYRVPMGYGGRDEKQKSIFQNPDWMV